MTSIFISGLSLVANRHQPIYLTHIDGHNLVIEIRLLATFPKSQQANMGMVAHGETSDLRALGILETAVFRIGMEKPTEMIPGVQLIVRRSDSHNHVTRSTVAMVISADPKTWRIERKAVMDARIRNQSRPLFSRDGRH